MDKPFKLSPKVIIKDAKGRCLLLKRSGQCRHFVGKWEFPGGKLEPGEDFETALLREVKEETGLTISLWHVVGAMEWELPELRFACLVMEGRVMEGEVTLSEEHTEFAWVPVKEMPDMDISDSFVPFIKTYVLSN